MVLCNDTDGDIVCDKIETGLLLDIQIEGKQQQQEEDMLFPLSHGKELLGVIID